MGSKVVKFPALVKNSSLINMFAEIYLLLKNSSGIEKPPTGLGAQLSQPSRAKALGESR